MFKLRTLAVTFDHALNPWELPRFRGAIAGKVGLEHDWFHNHNNETGGLHHRYPLIQYKVCPHNGGFRPMLLCLDQGIEEAHHLFSQPDWNIELKKPEGAVCQTALRIARLHVDQTTLNVWEHPLAYRLHNWQALNTDHYRTYRNLDGIAERFSFLQDILASHILSFARGVGWTLPRRFDVKITRLLDEKFVEYKGVKVLGFSLEFKTDVSLPEWIGLGKGAGVGFGVLRRPLKMNIAH